MAWGYGLKTVPSENNRNLLVTNVNDGEYIKVAGVDLGKGAKRLSYHMAAVPGSSIEVHIDSENGPLLGTIKVGKSGSLERFKTFTTGLSKTAGVHDLYFVFHGEKGAELMKLDWWRME